MAGLFFPTQHGKNPSSSCLSKWRVSPFLNPKRNFVKFIGIESPPLVFSFLPPSSGTPSRRRQIPRHRKVFSRAKQRGKSISGDTFLFLRFWRKAGREKNLAPRSLLRKKVEVGGSWRIEERGGERRRQGKFFFRRQSFPLLISDFLSLSRLFFSQEKRRATESSHNSGKEKGIITGGSISLFFLRKQTRNYVLQLW